LVIKGGAVNGEKRKLMISIVSTAVAFWLASRLAERFIQQPEVRGVQDDLKEGLLQAAFSLAATVVASSIIRRLVGSRWGA
jgi:uncharacterized membrane protein required for colicin V production